MRSCGICSQTKGPTSVTMNHRQTGSQNPNNAISIEPLCLPETENERQRGEGERRDKETEKGQKEGDRERQSERGRHRYKEREGEREREKERERDRVGVRERERDGDRDREKCRKDIIVHFCNFHYCNPFTKWRALRARLKDQRAGIPY